MLYCPHTPAQEGMDGMTRYLLGTNEAHRPRHTKRHRPTGRTIRLLCWVALALTLAH